MPFLEFRARFLVICRQKKKSQVLGHFLQKSLLSLTPLILVDYSTHIDTNYGTVHFVFKVIDSHLIDQCIFVPEGVNFL